MAEKKGVGHAYNVDFLNVVFAASSIFLFACVVWMVWDDFDREWKNTQRRIDRLAIEGRSTDCGWGPRRNPISRFVVHRLGGVFSLRECALNHNTGTIEQTVTREP